MKTESKKWIELRKWYNKQPEPKCKWESFKYRLRYGSKKNGTYPNGETKEQAIKLLNDKMNKEFIINIAKKNNIAISTVKNRFYRGIKLDSPNQGQGGARRKPNQLIIEEYNLHKEIMGDKAVPTIFQYSARRYKGGSKEQRINSPFWKNSGLRSIIIKDIFNSDDIDAAREFSKNNRLKFKYLGNGEMRFSGSQTNINKVLELFKNKDE